MPAAPPVASSTLRALSEDSGSPGGTLSVAWSGPAAPESSHAKHLYQANAKLQAGHGPQQSRAMASHGSIAQPAHVPRALDAKADDGSLHIGGLTQLRQERHAVAESSAEMPEIRRRESARNDHEGAGGSGNGTKLRGPVSSRAASEKQGSSQFAKTLTPGPARDHFKVPLERSSPELPVDSAAFEATAVGKHTRVVEAPCPDPELFCIGPSAKAVSQEEGVRPPGEVEGHAHAQHHQPKVRHHGPAPTSKHKGHKVMPDSDSVFAREPKLLISLTDFCR